MREMFVDVDGSGVKLRILVDSEETDKLNHIERKLLGKGMTAGGNMRKVANIDEEELYALIANGDIDALDFAHSGYSDKYALRRLLQKFPRWRCSEGAI